MDGGFRTSPRPTERRVASRPEPTYRQPEEPQATSEPSKPVIHHTGARSTVKQKKPMKRFLWPIIAAVIFLALVAGWLVWSNKSGGAVAIDGSKYQAVFFSNGQVYFGKLHAGNGDYMRLTDIYYLQSQQSADSKDSANPQETGTNQNNVQLVKLGEEIHGPEDEMIISKDQVLFYENLKPDGKVAQSIDKSKDK